MAYYDENSYDEDPYADLPPGFIPIAAKPPEPVKPDPVYDDLPPGFVPVVKKPEPATPDPFDDLPPGFVPVPPPVVAEPAAPKMPEQTIGEQIDEAGWRVLKGGQEGIEDVQAGARQQIAEMFRSQRNPYLNKSVAEAKADIPRLSGEIAAAEGRVEDVADREDITLEEARQLRLESPKVTAKMKQLEQAKESATGVTTEGFLGNLSRSAEDVAEADRQEKKDVAKNYVGKVFPQNNENFWMQVADSMGGSIPSMAVSMVNPVVGLSLMYAQTYEQSRGQFLEKGGDPALAHEYATKQAAMQTPLELLGDVAVARLLKGVIGRMASGEGAENFGKFLKERAIEFGKSFAGEVGVTTPGQSLIEDTLAEEYGIQDKTNASAKLTKAWEAAKVAAAQTLIMGGAPTAIDVGRAGVASLANKEANKEQTTQQETVPPPAVVPPPGVSPDGITEADLAAAPPVPGAPPIAPGVTIEAAPTGEVPGAPAPGVPPSISTPLPPETTVPPPAMEVPISAETRQGLIAKAPAAAPAAAEVSTEIQAGLLRTQLDQVTQSIDQTVEPTERASLEVQKAEIETKLAAKQAVDVAKQQIETLQASNAPKTAEALAAVTKEGVDQASVSLDQMISEVSPAGTYAEEDAAAPPLGPAAPTGETRFAPAAAAPAAAVEQEGSASIYAGGQHFTGDTHAEALTKAQKVVGREVAVSGEAGWIGPDGKFTSSRTSDVEGQLAAAVRDNAPPDQVTRIEAKLAQAQQRDQQFQPVAAPPPVTLREAVPERVIGQPPPPFAPPPAGQLPTPAPMPVQPGQEVVTQSGIKGQEAVVARPSAMIAGPLKGVKVNVEGIAPTGERVTTQQDATEALMETKKDRTAFELLLDCLT